METLSLYKQSRISIYYGLQGKSEMKKKKNQGMKYCEMCFPFF